MTRLEKQEAERRILMACKQAYPAFPVGEITHDDKPDTIVIGSHKVGIEITGFDLVDGGDDNSERQQSLRREGVVQETQKLYSAAGGKPVELTFGFDRISKQRRKVLPIELAAFAKRIEDKVSQTIILEWDGAPSEVRFAWNAGQLPNPTWRAQQCYGVGLMDKERLEKIIREKEVKARGYQPCDAYWLLVFVNFFDRAQDQEIRIDNPHVHSGVFEKIVVFNTVFNQIVEVK